jgi:hypothetical protein
MSPLFVVFGISDKLIGSKGQVEQVELLFDPLGSLDLQGLRAEEGVGLRRSNCEYVTRKGRLFTHVKVLVDCAVSFNARLISRAQRGSGKMGHTSRDW